MARANAQNADGPAIVRAHSITPAPEPTFLRLPVTKPSPSSTVQHERLAAVVLGDDQSRSDLLLLSAALGCDALAFDLECVGRRVCCPFFRSSGSFGGLGRSLGRPGADARPPQRAERDQRGDDRDDQRGIQRDRRRSSSCASRSGSRVPRDSTSRRPGRVPSAGRLGTAKGSAVRSGSRTPPFIGNPGDAPSRRRATSGALRTRIASRVSVARSANSGRSASPTGVAPLCTRTRTRPQCSRSFPCCRRAA
jgi:hypothetical protein